MAIKYVFFIAANLSIATTAANAQTQDRNTSFDRLSSIVEECRSLFLPSLSIDKLEIVFLKKTDHRIQKIESRLRD